MDGVGVFLHVRRDHARIDRGEAAADIDDVHEHAGAGDCAADLKPFRFYGPTCDSIDHMPGPFYLPADVREGDFIEIGMLGAYGVAMSTGFNGYGEHELAAVEDAPMASLYGLAPRSIPTVRTSAEEQARKVVRLSRPKGKAGQRKQRRR